MALRPVEYDKKMKLSSNDYDRHEFGFIAQELKEVIPEIVDSATNAYAEVILAVDYNSLIPVLTKAIQEQQSEIEALRAENAALKASEASTQSDIELIRAALEASGITVNTAAK